MEGLSLVKDVFVPINLYWYDVKYMAKPHILALPPLGTNVGLSLAATFAQCLLLFLDNDYIQIYLNLKFSSSRIHVLRGSCVCLYV